MFKKWVMSILVVLLLFFRSVSVTGAQPTHQDQLSYQNQSEFSDFKVGGLFRPAMNQEREIGSHPPFEEATAIAVGGHHSCALGKDGNAVCWGDNRYGQLGNGSNISSNNPVEVIDLSLGLSALVVGGWHTCAITNSGGVMCWGNNHFGQLGDGTNLSMSSPVHVAGLSSGVLALAAGEYHTCALTNSGGVKCWGNNGNGQLGDGSNLESWVPVDVTGLSSGVSTIGAGFFHTCAVTNSGGVKCWGYNNFGQLGDGTTTSRNTPVDVNGLSSGISEVTGGIYHSCAVSLTGSAKCWGANMYGQLGDGTTINKFTPVDVSGLLSGIEFIYAGEWHTCGVDVGNGVKCWGDNRYGQLGNGTFTPSMLAVDVINLSGDVISAGAGKSHTCALVSPGSLECWGYGGFGQLGNGANIWSSTPVNLLSLSNSVQRIDLGGYHTCAVTSSGQVKCWGDNFYGQIGITNLTNLSSTPQDVTGLSSGIIAITAGEYHTCALTSGGGVKCWGYNGDGQLGDGTFLDSWLPVDVSGLSSGVSAIHAGGNHTCALTNSGGVKCWGDNSYGQLGDGSTTSRSTPVNVSGLTSGIAKLATGGYHTCAVTDSGGVKCWGNNFHGQVGDGTTENRSSPVNVSGLSIGINNLSAGAYHNCVLTNTGGVKCWGNNDSGQLGDGTVTGRITPVDATGLTSGVSTLAAGGLHTCALTTNGGVKCWGENESGQLGDGTTSRKTTAVNVSGLSNGVLKIAAGDLHSCATQSSSGTFCWGDNSVGQLGDGAEIVSNVPTSVIYFLKVYLPLTIKD